MSDWFRSGYIPVAIVLVMLLLLVSPVTADERVGGTPLETVQTGDLRFDVDPAIAEENDTLSITGETPLEKEIDLTIGGLVNTVFAGAVFCNVPNEIRILSIKNNGIDTAENIVVAVYDDAVSTEPVATTTIPILAGGTTTTITLVDSTLRTVEGGTVTYRAVLDPENLIPETNEANNERSSFPKPLRYNGYMGAQYWTGKEEIKTYRTYDLHGEIIHSFGNSSYRSGSFGSGWTEYAVGWTAENLTIPDGATLREARLYVPYCWDNSGEASNVTIAFNGAVIPRERDPWEVDQSNFGAYDGHWYGLMTYNVTDEFNVNEENTAVVSRTNSVAKFSPAGLTLAVVYEDPLKTRKQIFINEGFDLLGADRAGYGTTEEQAISYQEFTGMTIEAGAEKAMLTTFVPWGAAFEKNATGEGNLFVNGVSVGYNVWEGVRVVGESDDPQVAVDTRDILEYLNQNGTGNVIAIQSTAGSTPCMVAERAFLVVEYPAIALTAAFTGTPTSGDKPLTVAFTDESTVTITKREWDFGDGGNSTDQNPVHVYTAAGTYTVNLTVTNAAGSDTEVKANYITVTEPGPDAPVANFTANVTAGDAPLAIRFTDESTGSPTTWAWDFGDGGNSTEQNPVHVYTAGGTHTVKLTAMRAGGSDTLSRPGYITVTGVKGDFNGDGKVDIGDVALVAYMVVGKSATDPAADFNENGAVDIGDAAKIAYYYVKKVPAL